MAKHARGTTEEQITRLERNRQLLLDAIAGRATCASSAEPTPQGALTLILERFVVPQDRPGIVPFEGAYGVERLLDALTSFGFGPIFSDGHLVGIEGGIAAGGDPIPLPVRCTVGAGAQLVLEVGPSDDLTRTLNVIAAFDRHVHLAAQSLGRSYRLLAQGYHPFANSPSDIVVVPTAANAYTNAHLSRTGHLARDMMRCTAGTRVRLPLPADPAEACAHYRLACALAPLAAFLCDNTLKVRDRKPATTPRMARALVFERVDHTRCGVVDGTFFEWFDAQAYECWLEGIAPIYFTSTDGVCFSTETDPLERVLEERELTLDEACDLLTHVFPWARWDGSLDLLAADSLQPRQAAGYAALVKGLILSPEGRCAAEAFLGVDKLTDLDVTQAFTELRRRAWDARVYGRPITQLAHELAAIASRNLARREERNLLDGLAQLWDVGMVPRDALVMGWERTRPLSREEEAALLWGEGAVIPYEQLEGEPPAGSTSVMSLEQLRQET